MRTNNSPALPSSNQDVPANSTSNTANLSLTKPPNDNSNPNKADNTTIEGSYDSIIWDNIPKFQLPSQPSHRRSWIWTQGYEVEEIKTGDRYWLCKTCHRAKKHQSHIWKASGGTGRLLEHMRKDHQLSEAGPLAKKRKFLDTFQEPDGTLTKQNRDIMHRLITTYNPDRVKTKLTRWIVHDNIAFNQVESPFFRDFVYELGGIMHGNDLLPTHRTIRDWIIRDFNRFKGIVVEQIQNALSRIHISFDLWTSRSLLTLCGIVVHFINNTGKLCTFLLSLPELVGSHAGVNIVEYITTIIQDYQIHDRIGYFVLDNADNNDTAVADLAETFGFDMSER
jgi:hypothetical protein